MYIISFVNSIHTKCFNLKKIFRYNLLIDKKDGRLRRLIVNKGKKEFVRKTSRDLES